MKITDIIPDFSTMTNEQIEETIRGVRRSRTTAKAVTVEKRPTKQAAKANDTAEKVMKSISPQQLEMLKKLFSQ